MFYDEAESPNNVTSHVQESGLDLNQTTDQLVPKQIGDTFDSSKPDQAALKINLPASNDQSLIQESRPVSPIADQGEKVE